MAGLQLLTCIGAFAQQKLQRRGLHSRLLYLTGDDPAAYTIGELSTGQSPLSCLHCVKHIHYNDEKRNNEMLSAAVKKRANEAWLEYEKAIVDAWRFPKGAKLLASGFVEAIETFDDSRMEDFIQWLQTQAKDVRSMKRVG